ncbi:MAG: DinB family protein [Isosphaeraceae bacterium]
MNIDDCRRLLAYDDWANREVLKGLQTVASPPSRAVELMAHLIAARTILLDRLKGRADTVKVWPGWDLDETARLLEILSTNSATHLDGLNSERFGGSVAYTNQQDARHETRVLDILLHLTTHGADHRGQIAMLLGSAGCRSRNSDFIQLVRSGKLP